MIKLCRREKDMEAQLKKEEKKKKKKNGKVR